MKFDIKLGTFTAKQLQITTALRRGLKRVAFVAGIQVGKSWLLARVMIQYALTSDAPMDQIVLIVSPTHDMTQVMVRHVKAALDEANPDVAKLIKWNMKPPVQATFPNGRVMQFNSAHNPDALRGIRPCVIGIDEGSYITAEAYDIIEGRTTQTAAPIVITTTPRGERHWLYQKVFVPGLGPSHKHHNPGLYDPERFLTVTANIFDNPYIAEDEREAKIKAYGGKDSPWARQELFGEFVNFEGLVFGKFDERLQVKDTKHYIDTEQFEAVVGGIDFGFNDPSVVVALGLRRGVWYVLDEWYYPKKSLDELAAAANRMRLVYGIHRFWADSADPQKIDYLSRQGIPVLPVSKPRILTRVQYMDQLIMQGRFIVDPRAVQTLKELGTYSYEDQAEGKNPDQRKFQGDDHAMDAIGYALWMESPSVVGSASPIYNSFDTKDDEYISQYHDADKRRAKLLAASLNDAPTAGY